jgi:hypothetical protein
MIVSPKKSMSPNELKNLILEDVQGEVRETETTLGANIVCEDEDRRAEWLGLYKNCPNFLTGITLSEVDTDEIFNANNLPEIGVLIRVLIRKPQYEDQLNLFFAESLPLLADMLADFRLVRIAGIREDEIFATYLTDFEDWSEEEVAVDEIRGDFADPRSFVNDFSSTPVLPTDARAWVVKDPPTAEGGAYTAWKAVAVRKQFAMLSDRLSDKDGETVHHFDGPPACRITVPDEQLSELFDRLNSGVEWIYTNEPRDADARHLLLATEWARSYRKSNLDDLGNGALDSAKAGYQAYIKTKSAEALESLNSLRKNVLDETHKISDRGHDFAKSMWKDLAVASAPFVLKVFSDAASSTDLGVGRYLSFAAAIFLATSLFTQWFLNERWLRTQEKARGIWKLELNTALTSGELKDIADDPIARSVFDYRLVGTLVTLFYAVLIVVLVQYGRGVIDI